MNQNELHMLPLIRKYFVAFLNVCFTDIEELTRKTGNFKSFAVFVKMLESAIVKVGHIYVRHKKMESRVRVELGYVMNTKCLFTTYT